LAAVVITKENNKLGHLTPTILFYYSYYNKISEGRGKEGREKFERRKTGRRKGRRRRS
jgi:hypothetical protein